MAGATLTEPPETVWVGPRVVVAASRVEGRGLFAAEDIPSGTIVIRLGGRLVSSAELRDLIAQADADPAAPYVDTITVDDDAHLVLPPGTVAHFGNHSCDPTLWHVGPFDVAARRDVRRGEELTTDYGTTSGAAGFAMACRCGAPSCRGEVTSEDWRLPELQRRYAGHWAPALRSRIEAQRGDRP